MSLKYTVRAKQQLQKKNDNSIEFDFDAHHISTRKQAIKSKSKASKQADEEFSSNIEIQEIYNNLYRCMRSYLWNVRVVNLLIDIQDEVYKAFPDVQKLRRMIQKLKAEVKPTIIYNKDDLLQKCIDAFDEITDDTYVPLFTLGGANLEN